jgi:hypothetical protein
VAIVRPGFPQKLNPAEVAEVFEVPLSFLMNPDNHHHSSRVWDGAKRFFFTMPYGERHIWGITAGIVRILSAPLRRCARGSFGMTVSLRDWPFLRLPATNAVLQALDAAGGKTRIVGGAVRDALLGRAVTDADLATVYTPAEVIARAEEAGTERPRRRDGARHRHGDCPRPTL